MDYFEHSSIYSAGSVRAFSSTENAKRSVDLSCGNYCQRRINDFGRLFFLYRPVSLPSEWNHDRLRFFYHCMGSGGKKTKESDGGHPAKMVERAFISTSVSVYMSADCSVLSGIPAAGAWACHMGISKFFCRETTDGGSLPTVG